MALIAGLLSHGLAAPWWWLSACVSFALVALWRPGIGRWFLLGAMFALGGLSAGSWAAISAGVPFQQAASRRATTQGGGLSVTGASPLDTSTRREYAVRADRVVSRNGGTWRIQADDAWVRAGRGGWHRWPGSVALSGPGRPPSIEQGDLVFVSGTARRWRGRTYLRVGRDLVWLSSGPTPMSSVGSAVRRRLEDLVRPIHGVGAQVLWAMLLGGSVSARSALRQSFVDAGLIHLLVISGLHLALLSVLMFWCLSVLLRRVAFIASRWPIPFLAAASTLPVVWAYVLLVGRSPATFRAAVMVTTVLGGQIVGLRSDSARAVAFSAILLLLWRPDWLTHPGFQLSYAATGSLIWLARSGIDVRGRFAWVARLGAASVVASIGTAGLVAYHFGRMSVLGPMTNLVAVPLFCWAVLPLGFFGLLVGLVWPWMGGLLLGLAALVAQGGVWFVRSVVTWLPGMRFGMHVSLGMCLAYYGLLLAAARGWHVGSIPSARRRRWAAATLLLAALALLASGWLRARPSDSALVVSFLGLGKGEAVLVEFPSGQTILVDGGPSDSEFSPLIRFLRRKGVRTLDLVVATHPHADHVQGLMTVVHHFHVGELWVNGEVAGHVQRRLVEEAHRLGVPVGRPRVLHFGSVRLDIVRAQRRGDAFDGRRDGRDDPLPDPLLSVNDNSLVIRLVSPWGSVLLTGDIEVPEQTLLASGSQTLRSDVLKAPHHGSFLAVSKVFLRRVHPRVVVICGGPGKDVTRSRIWYRAVADRVVATVRGIVTLRLDGRGIHVFGGYRQR